MAAKHRKPTPEEAKAMAEIRRTFSAADLAKMFQPTPTVPLKDVIAELEAELAKGTRSKKGNSRPSRKKSA